MAKRKSNPGPAALEARKSIDELHHQLNNVICQLSCANAVLAESNVIDRDDDTSRARIVVHLGLKRLDEICEGLDRWIVGQAQPGGAWPAVLS